MTKDEVKKLRMNSPESLQFLNNATKFYNLMMMYRCAIREIQTKLEVLDDEFSVENNRNPISFIKTTVITRLQKIRTSAILATESLLRMYRTFYMSKAMESFANSIGKATKSIFGLIKASFAFALTPLGIALIAIAGAAYLIYKNWNMVGPYFISLWKRIETALIGAWNKIKPAWDGLMNVIPKLKIAISPALVALDNIFTMAINGQGAFESLIAVLQIVASIFGGVLVGAFIIAANILVGTVVATINVTAAIITGFLGVLEGIITFLTGVFTGNWEMAWQGIVKIFDSVFSAIKDIADGILDGVKETINGIIKSINSIQFTVPDIVPGIGGKTFEGLNIPLFANGVENFAGGPAIIHDKGAEIVDLPSGTRVIPHDKSIQTAYAQGRQDNQSNSNNFNFSINIYGANMKSDADMDELADKLMQRIYYQMQKRSINMNEGAV